VHRHLPSLLLVLGVNPAAVSACPPHAGRRRYIFKAHFNNQIGHAGIISACPIFVSIIPSKSVCLDYCKRKKIPVPDEWWEKISSFEGLFAQE
jgi:hypothetical protein